MIGRLFGFSPKPGGFTLIELVVVIAVLGLIAAAMLPRFTDLRGQSTATVTQALAGAVRSASAQAHLQCALQTTSCNPRSGLGWVTIEGTAFQMSNGYVDAGGSIGNNGSDVTVTSTGFTVSLQTATTKWVHTSAQTLANCFVTYREAMSPGAEPLVTVQTLGC